LHDLSFSSGRRQRENEIAEEGVKGDVFGTKLVRYTRLFPAGPAGGDEIQVLLLLKPSPINNEQAAGGVTKRLLPEGVRGRK